MFESDGIKYYEVIDRHAFDECDLSDVIFNYNHGGKVVARLRNKTLELTITERGLDMGADLSGSASGGSGGGSFPAPSPPVWYLSASSAFTTFNVCTRREPSSPPSVGKSNMVRI